MPNPSEKILTDNSNVINHASNVTDSIVLYQDTCLNCSRLVTNQYSTSFSLGIKMLAKKFHAPIYAIYGFVRFADEIVDTFFNYPRKILLDQFKQDTQLAIERGISFNPILQSFQTVVHQYKIEQALIDAFLYSMEMDLYDQEYDPQLIQQYIYGSAEVVGLMCLRIFCEGNEEQYEQLKPTARRLGAAFQKVNFLRDIKSDFIERGRTYFPNVDFHQFNETTKVQIEQDIEADFVVALEGIKALPKGAKLGVYTAYRYYWALFQSIKGTSAEQLSQKRIRVSNSKKLLLLIFSWLKQKTGGLREN